MKSNIMGARSLRAKINTRFNKMMGIGHLIRIPERVKDRLEEV